MEKRGLNEGPLFSQRAKSNRMHIGIAVRSSAVVMNIRSAAQSYSLSQLETRCKFDGVSTTSSEGKSGRQFCVFLVILCVCALVITVIALTVMRHRVPEMHSDTSASEDREMMHRLSYEVLKRTKQGVNEIGSEDSEKVTPRD
ncbi:uncharacterized protein LOC100901537 [Galendromus occidentalis]|uniref:Uncharacterized protein LOC100901537 n=1 Tax=Galendromus occidentalis TaxID=34638 RepID=A0AAJ6VWI2_9ACAR|nr:uncharacterized protein LOC100901537 [Galendromus occidentalis]